MKKIVHALIAVSSISAAGMVSAASQSDFVDVPVTVQVTGSTPAPVVSYTPATLVNGTPVAGTLIGTVTFSNMEEVKPASIVWRAARYGNVADQFIITGDDSCTAGCGAYLRYNNKRIDHDIITAVADGVNTIDIRNAVALGPGTYNGTFSVAYILP